LIPVWCRALRQSAPKPLRSSLAMTSDMGDRDRSQGSQRLAHQSVPVPKPVTLIAIVPPVQAPAVTSIACEHHPQAVSLGSEVNAPFVCSEHLRIAESTRDGREVSQLRHDGKIARPAAGGGSFNSPRAQMLNATICRSLVPQSTGQTLQTGYVA
jgi:hypothetical protein